VKYNNDKSWDYTNPNLPTGDSMQPQPLMDSSGDGILGSFGGPGLHALSGFPGLLESLGFFLENSRSWTVDSPGKISLKITHFFWAQVENKQQYYITQFMLTVAYLNTAYSSSQFFSARFALLNTVLTSFIVFNILWATKKVLENLSWRSWKVL